MVAPEAMGEGEPTRQKRKKKKPKPNHLELGVASKPPPSAPILQTPTQSPAPGTPILQEAAVGAARRKRKRRKNEQTLPIAQNPTFEDDEPLVSAQPHIQLTVSAEMILQEEVLLKKHLGSTQGTTSVPGHEMKPVRHEIHQVEEQVERVVLATKKAHKERKSSPSLSAAENPILGQEAKVTKKRKRRKQQDPSSNSPSPLDPGQAQPQGTYAPHASKPLPAPPFLETPARSPAPVLEEVEVAMGKRKMRTEQKVAALPLAQNPTSEEPAEECVLATKVKKKKKHKERNKTSLSLFAAAATEIPILEQEAKVTKKRKRSKEQEPPGYLALPLDLGQTQPQGATAPHVSKPLPAAPFHEAAAEVAMRKRKMREEQEVVALSLAKNTTLEGQREDAMTAKMKKKHKERRSSPSASMTAETTICEQEVKVNKKQKQQEPSGKSPLSLGPGQTQSHGSKAPLEQEREADGQKGSSTKKSNGKMPRVCVLSKRELIKEASKKQLVLPEGFVAFSDFVPSCTEQNPDNPPPYITFFDQFRYTPACGDHKPPLPRTPDRLSRLTTTETYRASNSNTSVASNTKQQDLGSGSQEKLNAQVKVNPQKKKQRKPSGNLLPIYATQTSCVQLLGTPAQHDEADAPNVDKIKKSNGKNARVCTPSKRELFKEHMLPELSELFASGTSKATNAVARKSKKKDSDSGSQEKLHAKETKTPEKKQRKRPPLLTRADKCSDKYRRVPLDQLITPPRSPHNLLQEKYASDPWKVIVICMLLNLTQGIQVKRIIEGFFECYPDAQSACNADPDNMAGYLAPLGLQHVKTTRIQRFSKEYVEKEWTYITELCGVGKYAADAYAIFCAGRATEVVPEDHKLVDYWNYVCFELPMIQGSQNVQETGVTERELAVMC